MSRDHDVCPDNYVIIATDYYCLHVKYVNYMYVYGLKIRVEISTSF